MSIWTCKKTAALGLCLALLSGCDALGPEAAAGAGGFAFTRRAPERLAVSGDAVIVAGPAGYCIDKGATRDGAETAFVLLASCAAITRNQSVPRPPVQALLTAFVTGRDGGGDQVQDQARAFEAFFGSEAGRAALARNGQADSVRIIQMFQRDGAFFVHASDSSDGAGSRLKQDYWRAIFDVNGRTVSASVVAFKDHPISDDASLATLQEFSGTIRQETRKAVAATQRKNSETATGG